MKLTKVLLLILISQSLANLAFGQLDQQNLIYSNYYLNPYLYNPSLIAPSGYTELAVNYRQQWTGINGAPSTATVNFQIPVNYRIGLGINLYNDRAGVLQTNTGLLSFAYHVYLGQNLDEPHKLSFGLSGGITNSNISKSSNPDDPALVNSNISNFDGQFGLNYQYHNFKLGFSLLRLFKSQVVAQGSFKTAGLDPLRSMIGSVSYNFKIGSRISFEPIVLYRTETNLNWFEGMGVLHIDNIAWIGGSYRQDVGPAGILGFNIKDKLKVGYAYEFASGPVSGLGNGTHEVQLILRLGKNKKEKPKKEVKEEEEPKEKVAEKPAEEEPKNEEPKEETQQKEPLVTEQHEVQKEVTPTVEKQPSVVDQNETKVVPPIVAEKEKVEDKPTIEEQPTEIKKTVTKSLDGNDLKPGNYVVVGAFISSQNAKQYAALLKKSGYPADVAFDPDKKYYIVHMGNAPTPDEARKLRDVYRQKSRYSFKDTWILVIE